MGFEFDPEKSAENKRKHGVDFEEAQALCSDPALLEVPAQVSDEPRWVVVDQATSPEPAHRLAVGDRHRVELQVQLGGQVERHPLGPLRLHHDLVLADDELGTVVAAAE